MHTSSFFRDICLDGGLAGKHEPQANTVAAAVVSSPLLPESGQDLEANTNHWWAHQMWVTHSAWWGWALWKRSPSQVLKGQQYRRWCNWAWRKPHLKNETCVTASAVTCWHTLNSTDQLPNEESSSQGWNGVPLEMQSTWGLTDLHALLKDLPPSSSLPSVSEIHQLSDISLVRNAFQYAATNATGQQGQTKKIQPKEILNYQEGVQDHE